MGRSDRPSMRRGNGCLSPGTGGGRVSRGLGVVLPDRHSHPGVGTTLAGGHAAGLLDSQPGWCESTRTSRVVVAREPSGGYPQPACTLAPVRLELVTAGPSLPTRRPASFSLNRKPDPKASRPHPRLPSVAHTRRPSGIERPGTSEERRGESPGKDAAVKPSASRRVSALALTLMPFALGGCSK